MSALDPKRTLADLLASSCRVEGRWRQGRDQPDMPIALPDLHCMQMVEAAGMVDRRVVVFAHNDARLVDRAILSQKINRVRNHDRVLRARPKAHAWLISAIPALIFRNRAAPERSGRTPVFDRQLVA